VYLKKKTQNLDLIRLEVARAKKIGVTVPMLPSSRWRRRTKSVDQVPDVTW